MSNLFGFGMVAGVALIGFNALWLGLKMRKAGLRSETIFDQVRLIAQGVRGDATPIRTRLHALLLFVGIALATVGLFGLIALMDPSTGG